MKTQLQFFLATFLIIPSLSFAQCGGTLSMNVSPLPPICNGDTVTITVNLSGGNAGWNFNIYKNSITPASKISSTASATDTPSVSTTYYATADSNGCQEKLDSIMINIYPMPSIYIFVTNGDTLFVPQSYASYQWYENGSPIPGATDTFFVPCQDGTYSVIVGDTNGCKAISYGTFVPVASGVCSIGIQLLSDNNKITIYPNPLTSSSTLQLNTQVTNAEVVIYDVLGKEMIRKKLTGDRMEIEKGSLESGVYFVRVMIEERQWVEKLIIE